MTILPTLKKTYRILAVFTVLLLASNVLLPAGTATVNLYCDSEMEGHSMHDCCDDSEMDHHERSDDTDDCLMLSFCEQAVDSPQPDTPAVMQHVKSIVVAELTDEIELLPFTTDRPDQFWDESVTEYHSPPLFLMNSVFLN
jgi:hypothetical protein